MALAQKASTSLANQKQQPNKKAVRQPISCNCCSSGVPCTDISQFQVPSSAGRHSCTSPPVLEAASQLPVPLNASWCTGAAARSSATLSACRQEHVATFK
jgi:hypothetical protein